jgi:Protein of unknown function (DUF1549)/Protein of unknown function (DUF1553)
MHRRIIFFIGLGGCFFAGLTQETAAAELDHWAAFRREQQSEVATLPQVSDPPTAPGENPIDVILASWRERQGITARPDCSDRVLIRRLYLDTIGLLPPPEAVDAFLADTSDDKVARAVRTLLADDRGYAEHVMTFWNDLLRNDEQTAIDGLRKPITRWLYQALLENMPYDQMVAELLNPGPAGPEGYLKGVNWRGRVNLSQRPPVQAAQNIAQVFLATSIRCASCHDGFTTTWKLKDAYGLASFFADDKLEMARCDKPTGVFVPARFLYPDLGEVSPDADLPTRRAAVARMVTRPKNPRFARVLVNRLWSRMLGQALAQPLDEMDEADCPELLDWLAYDFMKHDYDIKRTTTLILTSKAYRRQVEPGKAEGKEAVVSLGPVPRRMSSEQFLDAIACLTESWIKPKQLVDLALDGDRVRAWRHKRPSALATALGRPNREQVVTKRGQEATVLQALEVTNGQTLNDLLTEGAEALLTSPLGMEADTEKAVDTLYMRALARPATPDERAIVGPMLGRPGDPHAERLAGYEDVLWMLVNSPEFQIIH